MRLHAAESQADKTQAVSALRWPDAVAFREAIQNPKLVLGDPELQKAEVALDRRGLPLAYSGRFAIVFRLRTQTGDWALRCFTHAGDAAERRERYNAIAAQIRRFPEPFAAFRYLDQGIRVGGAWYPAVAMRWAEGETLGRFVEAQRANPDALLALCRALTRLLRDLEAAGIAHGDWQHDNLLISDEGRTITLVDYDGMYVGALAGRPPGEMGHPNYQHPARTLPDYGVGLDRFSHLAMQTALLALAREPSLWDRFNDGESLLLRRADFLDPEGSPVFAAIRRQCDGDAFLSERLRQLEAACVSGRDGVVPGEEAVRPLPESYRREAPARPHVSPHTAFAQRRATEERQRQITGLSLLGLLLLSGLAVGNYRPRTYDNFPATRPSISWPSTGLPFQQPELRADNQDLRNGSFQDRWLRGASFRNSDLRRVSFRDVSIFEADFDQANLRHADLRNAYLLGARLRNADLGWATLRAAHLNGANLQNAILRGADLERTDLAGADLRAANLRGANLRRADLSWAKLQGADLRNADLRDADLQYTYIEKAGLAGSRYCKHTKWPSDLDPRKTGAERVSD